MTDEPSASSAAASEPSEPVPGGSASPQVVPPASKPHRPRRPSPRTVVVAAVVLVVVAVGCGIAVALTLGGGGSSETASPEQAVRSYDQVFKDADCQGFNDLTTKSFRGTLGLTSCDKFAANAQDGSIASFELEVTSSAVDGGTSTVRTRETFMTATGKQSIDLVYSLVKAGDDWQVNGIARDKTT